MKIGALDGVLAKPWLELFDEAKQLGFDGVELGVGGDYQNNLLWTAEGRKQLRDQSEQNGIPIGSVCLHSYWQWSLADENPETRATGREIAVAYAKICQEMGVDGVLMPVTGPTDIPNEVGAQRWIDEVKQVAGEIEKTGVRFGLENVGRDYGHSAESLIHLVDSIASPAIGVYYDPGNAKSKGYDPAEEVKQLGIERIVRCHVKDPGGKVLGEGTVDLKAFVGALMSIGYDSYLTLETPANDDAAATAKANLDYLRGLLVTG
jgi:sugar phosphate isomerase/epimerase